MRKYLDSTPITLNHPNESTAKSTRAQLTAAGASTLLGAGEAVMLPSQRRAATVAVYLVLLSPAAATQVVTGSVASGVGLLPRFGHAVDVRGDRMIVGAPGDSAGATMSVGSAILFRRVDNTWVEDGRLQPADAAQFDQFGNSVAIDGDLCAVGAPSHDAKASNAGAVYIYRRGATLWLLEAKLFAETPQANASFGEALDLDGTTLAVGQKNYDISAPLRDAGAVCMFSYSGATWVTNQTLVDPAAGGTNAFGDAVCLRGNQLAVGSPNKDTTVVDAGGVLVFKRIDGASPWTLAQSLSNPLTGARDYFGIDVAIDSDWLLAGAAGDDTVVATDSGSAFAFQRTPVLETWTHQATLLPADLTPNCGFGSSVALSGIRGVVGAPYDDAYGLNSGAGYCYIRAHSVWYLNEKLLSDEPISYPTMGWSAALHDGTTVLGAWQANQPAGSGSATIFECSPTPVVVIPGIAGSVMEKNGSQYWPAFTPGTIAALNLRSGTPGIEAVDLVRRVVIIPPDLVTIPIYGPLIEFMTNELGYTEYAFRGVPDPFTSDYLVTNEFERRPDLFLFPYDWRRSNAAHSPTLNAYIGRIRELHNGRKVNVIAHSMGGLVLRRYVLDYTANAEVSVRNVATVGSPLWGAPIGIYRLLTGVFFDNLLDHINAPAMRDVLFSIPGMHELLPTTLYFDQGGSPVIQEGGVDENGNGHSDDAYDRAAVIAYVTAERNRFGYQDAPFPNNIQFHDGNGGRQDDWSLDSGAIRYLHVIGTGGRTTTQLALRASAYLGGPFPAVPMGASIVSTLDRKYGPGDETVPALSARRATAGQMSPFWAPNTVGTYEVTEADDAGHNKMLLRYHVWNAIFSFFGGSAIPSSPSAPPAVQSAGLVGVTVYGAGFVDVYDDAGNSNTPLSSIAALPVPGVSPIYGGDAPWCSLDIEEGRHLWIRGRFTNESAMGVIEVVRRNDTNLPVSLYRYILSATSSFWRVAITSTVPEVARDANGNGVFEPAELIAHSHQATSAGGVDATAPRLGATLVATSTNLLLTLNGADAPTGGLVFIFYSTGTVAMTAYTAPLSFPINQQAAVAGFAEDALGNRSGWLSLVLNPSIRIGKTNNGVAVQWPLSDGYTLEQAPDPRGPWAAADTATVPADLTRIAVLSDTNRGFYRLRFTGMNL